MKFRAVVHLAEVGELVQYHIVDEAVGQEHEVVRQLYFAPAVAYPQTFHAIRYAYTLVVATQYLGPMVETSREESLGRVFQKRACEAGNATLYGIDVVIVTPG